MPLAGIAALPHRHCCKQSRIGQSLDRRLYIGQLDIMRKLLPAEADRVYRDAFGPRRCFWGTDLTAGIDRFPKLTYQQRVTHFTEELPFLSEQDKDWVMGRAIMRRLGWT